MLPRLVAPVIVLIAGHRNIGARKGALIRMLNSPWGHSWLTKPTGYSFTYHRNTPAITGYAEWKGKFRYTLLKASSFIQTETDPPRSVRAIHSWSLRPTPNPPNYDRLEWGGQRWEHLSPPVSANVHTKLYVKFVLWTVAHDRRYGAPIHVNTWDAGRLW